MDIFSDYGKKYTPVAIVQNDTKPEEKWIIGSVKDIPFKVEFAGITDPAIVMVGKLVRLHSWLLREEPNQQINHTHFRIDKLICPFQVNIAGIYLKTGMKQNKKNCDLQSCVLCRQCIKDWLPAIDANRKSFHFKKGELLFKEGETMTGMFFVNTGLVKVHKKWNDDKELILRIARSGDIVGHRGLGADTIYPVSGTALEPTDTCYIDLDFFDSTLKVNPGYLYHLMMFFAAELKESEKRMRNLAHMPVKGRIANALLFLRQKFGVTKEGGIDIALSRQDLASYTATTYESLFRIMNELVAEHAIKTEGKNIFILNDELLVNHTRQE